MNQIPGEILQGFKKTAKPRFKNNFGRPALQNLLDQSKLNMLIKLFFKQ